MKNSNKILIGWISKEITENKIKNLIKMKNDSRNYFKKKFCPITIYVIMIVKDASKKIKNSNI